MRMPEMTDEQILGIGEDLLRKEGRLTLRMIRPHVVGDTARISRLVQQICQNAALPAGRRDQSEPNAPATGASQIAQDMPLSPALRDAIARLTRLVVNEIAAAAAAEATRARVVEAGLKEQHGREIMALGEELTALREHADELQAGAEADARSAADEIDRLALACADREATVATLQQEQIAARQAEDRVRRELQAAEASSRQAAADLEAVRQVLVSERELRATFEARTTEETRARGDLERANGDLLVRIAAAEAAVSELHELRREATGLRAQLAAEREHRGRLETMVLQRLDALRPDPARDETAPRARARKPQAS